MRESVQILMLAGMENKGDGDVSRGGAASSGSGQSSCCAAEETTVGDPLTETITTVEQANTVMSTFSNLELLEVIQRVISDNNIVEFTQAIVAVQQLTVAPVAVIPDGLLDTATLREIVEGETKDKVQEALESVKNCCVGLWELERVHDLIHAITVPPARGAAECQVHVYRLLRRQQGAQFADAEAVKISKKANRDMRELVVLRIIACISDLKEREVFDQGISDTYHGDLLVAFEENTDLRAQLLLAFHKYLQEKGLSEGPMSSNNQRATKDRGRARTARKNRQAKSEVANPDQNASTSSAVASSSAAPGAFSSSSAAVSSAACAAEEPMYVRPELQRPRGPSPQYDKDIGALPRRQDITNLPDPVKPVSVPQHQAQSDENQNSRHSPVSQGYSQEQHHCSMWDGYSWGKTMFEPQPWKTRCKASIRQCTLTRCKASRANQARKAKAKDKKK
jgi:hypothetical protein